LTISSLFSLVSLDRRSRNMFWKTTTLLAMFVCAAVAFADGKVRTWTSIDGRTMEAEFVRELDGDVTFLKDGKLIVIRVEKLSEKDQRVVKDLSAGQDPASSPSTNGGSAVKKPTESPPKPKKPMTIQSRTWTDRFGVKSSGKFIRVDGNDVVINRGTRVITVPFANLSDGDQEYVREVLISQGKEGDIPTGEVVANGPGGRGVPDGGNPLARGGAGTGPGVPALPPGTAPGGGIGGGMPPGNRPPGGRGGIGPNRGPGMNGGAGMPPGMANGGIATPLGTPPAVDGINGPGIGPSGGPPGMPNSIGGPMGTGFPGSNIPGSIPNAATLPNGGMGAGGLPGMGPPGASIPSGGAMPGMGSMPGTSGMGATGPGNNPGFSSMEQTSIPGPNIQIEEYFQCSKCGAKLTKQESLGTSCPRCNATWGFKQDQFGNKTMTSAGRGQVTSIAAIIVVVVLVGVIVFIALFVGIIVAIVKATSSNTPRPVHPQQMPQQRYY
jgi:hypothetical protein